MGFAARLVGRRGERDLMWIIEFGLLAAGMVTVVMALW